VEEVVAQTTALVADVEDLVANARPKPRAGNRPRKLTWKRKQSPLVPPN